MGWFRKSCDVVCQPRNRAWGPAPYSIAGLRRKAVSVTPLSTIGIPSVNVKGRAYFYFVSCGGFMSYSGTRIISSRGFGRPSSRYLLRSLIPNFAFAFSALKFMRVPSRQIWRIDRLVASMKALV